MDRRHDFPGPCRPSHHPDGPRAATHRSRTPTSQYSRFLSRLRSVIPRIALFLDRRGLIRGARVWFRYHKVTGLLYSSIRVYDEFHLVSLVCFLYHRISIQHNINAKEIPFLFVLVIFYRLFNFVLCSEF